MNNFCSDIIKLIKSAILDEAYALSDEFNISITYELAKRHQITSLMYYGAIRCGVHPEDPVLQEMFLDVARDIVISERQRNEINKLFKCFEEQKIDYMPLKGVSLKKMYPKTEMRSMGDADVLIKTEQYGVVRPLMFELGYKEKVESDHEYVWTKPGLFLELHKRLIPSYNKDFYKYFGNGWKFAKKCDGTCYSMTAEDEFIYLFAHFSKHYRDAGIGLRHIVDLWIYRRHNSTMDEKYIKINLKKLQLDVFYENVLKTLSVWFDGAKTDAVTEFLTSVIFNNCVYGNKQASILSAALKESKELGNSKKIRIRRVFSNVFPPHAIMREKFPVLKKVPILLPIFWVVRLINTLLFKRNELSGKINEYKTISSERIDSYKDGLNFVGLDFNFKE